MDTKTVQIALIDRGFPVGNAGADGLWGTASKSAATAFQKAAGIPVTGVADLATIAALKLKAPPAAAARNVWPTQAGVNAFYGKPGTNQTLLTLPYAMTYDGKSITRMTINTKCAKSAERALIQISKEYTAKERMDLGLAIFGGCYNNRAMRGGSAKSMHAYACALDFDPNRNQLKWGRDRARLAKADCEAFWRAWEAEGWISLGRTRNFDWMHVQAARL